MTTAQIYKGSIAFIVLQVIMVAAVIAFPSMVTGGIGATTTIDADKALENHGSGRPIERRSQGADDAVAPGSGTSIGPFGAGGGGAMPAPADQGRRRCPTR